jgi:hypothetical protein
VTSFTLVDVINIGTDLGTHPEHQPSRHLSILLPFPSALMHFLELLPLWGTPAHHSFVLTITLFARATRESEC